MPDVPVELDQTKHIAIAVDMDGQPSGFLDVRYGSKPLVIRAVDLDSSPACKSAFF
jgi:hypothetical protein